MAKEKVTIKSKEDLDPKKQAFDAFMQRLKELKTELLFLNIALILLGIVMIAIPKEFNQFIGQILGCVLCVWGVIRCIAFFRLESSEIVGSYALVQGAAMLGFGLFFLFQPDRFSNLLNSALILLILIAAVLKLQNAITFFKVGIKNWWLHLIIAVVMLIFGIIALVKPGFVDDENGLLIIMTVIMGISLVISGIWDTISVLILSKAVKVKAKEWDEQGLLSSDGEEKAKAKTKAKAATVIHAEAADEVDDYDDGFNNPPSKKKE